MSNTPRRRTEQMHLGRLSSAGTLYFVTFVTASRIPWLCGGPATTAMLSAVQSWHAEGDGAVLALCVMPDHVHVLFELGRRLHLGRWVSRWKTAGRRAAGYRGDWQRDFWEHRLRDGESLEDYGLYLFLNPYRAGLSAGSQIWPGWWVPEPSYFQFTEMLGPGGGPPQEWIEWPDERFSRLATCE